MYCGSGEPLKKKKKKSAAYLARKKEKRRLKGENARTMASRLNRKNRDLRRSAVALEARKDIDLRRSTDALPARKNRDLRRSADALKARKNTDVRYSTEALAARKNTDLRRTSKGLEARQHRSRSEGYRHRLVEDYYERRRDMNAQIEEYELAIRRGPTFTCQCCGCLFFLEAIQTFKKAEITVSLGNFFNEVYCLPDSSEDLWLCITCSRDINKKKVPRLCLNNGLRFPIIPPELAELTQLEERLVAPRIPFMQIRPLRVGKQYGIKGNVVNVPISVEKSIDVLPRTFDKAETIQLKLRRMKRHTSDYLNEFIRPSIVYEAAKLLVQKPLYIEEGVNLTSDWTLLNAAEHMKFIVDAEDQSEEHCEEEKLEDKWDETVDDNPVNPNKEETLLKEGIIFAPGEGEKPLSILSDKYVEELAFPKIFCGEKRTIAKNITYSDISRSDLKRADRRCCTPAIIFFKLRKKETENVNNAIQIHLRKGHSKIGNLSAQQVLGPGFLSNLVDEDQAYNVLKGDRSSPAYWQSKMKELMAMIRQLGIPTFFLTLSAAETRWPELLVILVKILRSEDITEEDAMRLSFQEKSDLIRQDPVTCARYFDHRIRQLFKVIKAPCGPFAEYEVQDTYIRVEFQSRGSPHVHCLLWLKDAPTFDAKVPNSVQVCEQFIDKFISCSDGISGNLAQLQYHKHSGTCKKTSRDDIVCRFGIPMFPMKKTCILTPLKDNELSEEELDAFDHILDRIEQQLVLVDSMVKKRDNDNDHMTFDEFLEKCQVSEDLYIRVIRNSLKRTQVFLKRDPKDIRTNAYNRTILELHRANMDLQFILDPYACVHYILNYINKSNRGMSVLLKEVVEECKLGNVSHRQKLYRISSKFLNCSEVSIQEAVYILLGMSLSKASLDTIFINTGERDNRTKILKMKAELEKLDPESKDVMSNGIIEYYVNRPDELEDCCLADFAAKFTLKKLKEGELIEASTNHHLKNGLGILVQRKRPKIIRYRRYQKEKDPKNFYREKVMLYLPWRDEDIDILDKNVEEIYLKNLDRIKSTEKIYVHDFEVDLEEIQAQVEEDHRISMESVQEEVIAEEFQAFDHQGVQFNMENEVREKSNNESTHGNFLSPTILSDDNYLQLVRSLNEKQRNFLLGLMNSVKTSGQKPNYYFLTGGAGTGKSLLIKSVYQALNRWYSKGGSNPDKVKVILLGPTGMSAFNIRGTTLHSAFHYPMNQCGQEIRDLSPDLLNTIRNKLWELKFIIIDEISMVGSKMLGILDHRLKKIFQSKEIFGGISILFVGDFNQLRPVADSYAFEPIHKLQYSILAGAILWEPVKIYRLDEIMRQKDDLKFAQALNRLAVGLHTEEDKNLFKQRLFPKNSSLLPVTAIRLFPNNDQVDAYNDRVLQLRDGVQYLCSAKDFCNEWGKAGKQALYIVSQLPTRATYNLPQALSIKVGIRYMVSTNLDIKDGLVNGTSGILREVDVYQDKVQKLWFEFEEIDIGSKARAKAQIRSLNGNPLTPIERVVRDIQSKYERRNITVSRTQFPVLIAEAITIHKSQGQTYEQVVVDMARKLDLAKFYTALSRAKSLSGLFLVGENIIFPKERPASSAVSMEMKRLETESLLEFELKFLKLVKPNGNLALYFHNLPYLFKHPDDISCDLNIQACDILALVETRSNMVKINGFELNHSLAFEGNRPFGIAFYIREGLTLSSSASSNVDFGDEKSHIEYMKIDLQSFLLFIFYVSPTYPMNKFLGQIEVYLDKYLDRNLVIIGDWNIDRKSRIGERFQSIMENKGLQLYPQIDSPSTDRGTTIDYLFSSIVIEDSFYYESLVSDHKPIISILNAN